MIVVDASTLILLAKTELLDLFLESFPKAVISEAVEAEATRKQTFDALLIAERIKKKKIVVKKAKRKAVVEKIQKSFGLHYGEAETLALCLENNWKLVGTDDHSAIKACLVLKIKYVTSLGVLLKLCDAGKLTKEESLLKLKLLKEHGRYSEEVFGFFEKKMR